MVISYRQRRRRASLSSSIQATRRLRIERLEARQLLASDLGEAIAIELTSEPPGEVIWKPTAQTIINGTPTTQFPSVGIVGEASGGYCSGTLIAPQYVLSAAHCAVGVGNTAGRVTFGSTTYSTSQVIVHPNYSEPNFGTDAANDIALYRLNTPVVGITPSPIYRSTPVAGSLLTLVGFGGGGTGTSGSDGSFGTKRVGTTPIDLVTSTLIHWDFENNTESNTAPGDSGGPAFLQVGSEFFVAGVTSGGTLESAAIGDQSYDTRVDAYQSWIDGILTPTLTTNFVDYTTTGNVYSQNFNTLATSGTSSSLPSGWALSEAGTNANATYTGSNGSVTAGDTYSFGTTGSTDRALGGVQSGSLNPTVGVAIKNSTGSNLTSMSVGYVGEQWRLGATARADRLDFQYSLNATSLTDGVWVDANTLDFTAPITAGTVGPLDGNATANRSVRSSTIAGLDIPSGSIFWLRWNDVNATSADDGLGVDDFTFSATGGTSTNTAPTITTPSNQQTAFQTATSAIAFAVDDAQTAPASLIVSATSSNLALVPLSGIALSGSGANRTVTLTPANGQSGTTTIGLNVSDGSLSSTTSFVLTVNAGPQTTSNLRIVSYNIAGASGTGTPRTGFGTLLQAMGTEVVNGQSRQVDLFALQEVLSQATTSTIVANSLNNLYGTVAYASGTLNGATTGSGTQGVVYNSQTLQLLGEVAIGTASSAGAPRQTIRHHFRPIGTNGTSDFYVYNSHFKAADNSDDANRRFEEVQVIRNDADLLGQGANIIYVGDFNLYRSTEPAYQEFLSAGNGQAFDPINRPGNWSGNASFRDIFTQAPSATAQPDLGLDGGGLDDRLDFQLNSGELANGVGLEYRTGTYHTFGVNGSVAVNGSINDASNTALPGLANRTTVLGLLRTVSDHLPVVADYTYTIPVVNDAVVLNRRVFYNRSSSTVFGNGSGNPTNAIDPSKSALLPGQTASFANYTNTVNGINGLVVDIDKLVTATAADLQFATWDGINGSGFVPLTATPTVSVIANGGLSNSMRIKIEFENAAVRNTWLRVTVLANANTKLPANDVFYFGSAVGDSGTGNIGDPVIVRTNATDTSVIRQNQLNVPDTASISSPYDLNKDGRVNATDTSLVRQNQLNNILALFTAPGGGAMLANRVAESVPTILGREPTALDAKKAEIVARKLSAASGTALPGLVQPVVPVEAARSYQLPELDGANAFSRQTDQVFSERGGLFDFFDPKWLNS